MFINIDRYQISCIQYGKIPIRDSPHPTPPHAAPPGLLCVRPRHGVGWGRGASLMDIFPYWISDIAYLFLYTFFGDKPVLLVGGISANIYESFILYILCIPYGLYISYILYIM